jgi:hypothetical protein
MTRVSRTVKNDVIRNLFRRTALRYQFESLDQLSNARGLLGRKDQASEVSTRPLPVCGNAKQILILREEKSSQGSGLCQQGLVIHLARFVLLTCQYVDVAAT